MSSNSSGILYNYKDPLTLFTAVLLGVNSIFGIACNYLIIYLFIRNKDERGSFNLICVFRAASNLTTLVFTFSASFLTTSLAGYSIFSPDVETILISLALSIFLLNEYQTILVSVNRFIALFFPTRYSQLCGFKSTLLVIMLFYTYQTFHVVKEFFIVLPLGCYYHYNTELMIWTTIMHPDCNRDRSGVLPFFLVFFSIVVILNLLSFTKIVLFYKSSNHRGNESRYKIRKNAKLYLQTIVQDLLYVLSTIVAFTFVAFDWGRFWKFCASIFFWECVHSFEGFIMILFNEKLIMSMVKKTYTNDTSQERSQQMRSVIVISTKISAIN